VGDAHYVLILVGGGKIEGIVFFAGHVDIGVVIVETEDAIYHGIAKNRYLDTVARFIEAPVAPKAGREYRIGPERPVLPVAVSLLFTASMRQYK